MATKEEYEKALKEMNEAFYGIAFLRSETRRFDDNLNLLRELVNEHFEEKQETNLDHYKDDIAELFIDKLAIVDGKPERCECVTICDICDLYEKCNEHKAQEELRKWLKQPYKKPPYKPYKLSQFEFDLIQTYRDGNTDCELSVRRILRELKDKGYFKCVDYDTKVKDILENCEVVEDRKEEKK